MLKISLLPRFLAREKFDQLVTRPTHIRGGEDGFILFHFVSYLCSAWITTANVIIELHIESIISGLIDHAHLRPSERNLRTIVTQESHYYTDHDSVNVTFKNV